MKISARNVFPGTVRNITAGAINSEIAIEIASGVTVVSVITNESVKRLGLAPGKAAFAVIKASDVLVGAD